MKISTKSWHYRLILLFDWDPPRNLCGYFWAVVLALLAVPVFASGALLVVSLMTAPLWRFFVDLDGEMVAVVVGGAVDIGLLSAMLVSLVMDRSYAERRARLARGEDEYEVYKPRKPSLFREWLRAKHEKVCPMLEFERS